MISVILTSIALVYALADNFLSAPVCERPRIRREWRTLTSPEKLSYIQSVKCLQQLPSDFEIGGSRYDDFPYTHQAVGYKSMSYMLT